MKTENSQLENDLQRLIEIIRTELEQLYCNKEYFARKKATYQGCRQQ
ncbi:hypothetical protein ABHN05_19375 [Brevibacillus laterosporus]